MATKTTIGARGVKYIQDQKAVEGFQARMNVKVTPSVDTEALMRGHTVGGSVKPLSLEDRLKYREIYIRELLPWQIINGDSINLYSLKGVLLSRGYNRIVIGDYGAYIEITPNQTNEVYFMTAPGCELRNSPKNSNRKYDWLCHKNDKDIKIYKQLRTVSYADYVPGMYYVSPYSVKFTHSNRHVEKDCAFPVHRSGANPSQPMLYYTRDDAKEVFIMKEKVIAEAAKDDSLSLTEKISTLLATKGFISPSGHRMMVTGHRPNKLFGYNISDPKYDGIKQWLGMYIDAAVKKYPEVSFISGMALGADMIFAHEVNRRKLPLFAYIPTKRQYAVWPAASVKDWYEALVVAKSIHITNASESKSTWDETIDAMQDRNEDMVNDADTVLAIWNGRREGGTWNCIEYALKENKRVILYNPFKNIQADSKKPQDEKGGINWFIAQSR